MEVELLKDREDQDRDRDEREREMNGWMDRLTGEKYMHLSSLEVGKKYGNMFGATVKTGTHP